MQCGDRVQARWRLDDRALSRRRAVDTRPRIARSRTKGSAPSMSQSSDLLDAFMARREALLRYFTVRVGESEAQDLVQEIYLRCASLPADAEVRQPGGYLYRLGNNVLLDRMRQERARGARDHAWRDTHHLVASNGEDVSDVVPQDDALIARDQVRRIAIALSELPDAVQTSFRLHKLDGLPHAQVAERMGVSRSLIEKYMMRALRHLSARIGR